MKTLISKLLDYFSQLYHWDGESGFLISHYLGAPIRDAENKPIVFLSYGQAEAWLDAHRPDATLL